MSSRFGFNVVVRDYPYYDEDTGVYPLIARCGHKHKTQVAAQSCLEKLTRVRCKCDRENAICAKCDYASLMWLNAEVEERGKPKRHHEVPPVVATQTKRDNKVSKFHGHEPEKRMFKTDAELIAWANEQRRLYAEGELPKWQIDTLERIEGWSWDKNEDPLYKAALTGV